ncbi:hypothetical protein G5716_24710 [Bacillus pacificus]|nr:hypothetical protein [Bacillus pacificus]
MPKQLNIFDVEPAICEFDVMKANVKKEMDALHIQMYVSKFQEMQRVRMNYHAQLNKMIAMTYLNNM